MWPQLGGKAGSKDAAPNVKIMCSKATAWTDMLSWGTHSHVTAGLSWSHPVHSDMYVHTAVHIVNARGCSKDG